MVNTCVQLLVLKKPIHFGKDSNYSGCPIVDTEIKQYIFEEMVNTLVCNVDMEMNLAKVNCSACLFTG